MASELEILKKLTETLVSDTYLVDQTVAWEYAFNSVTDLVCITNTSYQIKFLNTKFLDKLSLEPEFCINKTINELFGKDIEPLDPNLFCKSGEDVYYGEVFFPELGGWFVKHRYVIKNTHSDVIGYTYMFSDVTDRKKAEARWHVSEARFSDLFKYMTVAAVVFAPINGGADFKVVDFNKAAENLDRVTKDVVVGKNISDLSSMCGCKKILEKLQRVFETGKSERIPADVFHESGMSGWREMFLMKLPSGEVVSLYTDETFKVEAQAELKHNEELLEGVFNVIPDIIGIQDANYNAIRYNKAGRAFFNVTTEEVKSKKCYELLGRSEPCEVCHSLACKKSKKPEKQTKFIKELNGWYDCRSYPILDDSGEVEYIVEHLRDVTELKKANIAKEADYKKLRTLFQRLHFIIAAVDGYVWEKEVVYGKDDLVYSYIDPALCRDFYKLDSKITAQAELICSGAIGKTSKELITQYCDDSPVHSFMEICTVADAHCIEQKEPCDYYEMGYIESASGELEWVVLRVRKEPVFNSSGQVVGLLGFADNCANDILPIRDKIIKGIADGSIEKLADTGNAKVFWIVKKDEEVTNLSYLDFP